MWNFNKTISDFIDRLAELFGFNDPRGRTADRSQKEAALVPVRVLHDGKYPNTSR